MTLLSSWGWVAFIYKHQCSTKPNWKALNRLSNRDSWGMWKCFYPHNYQIRCKTGVSGINWAALLLNCSKENGVQHKIMHAEPTKGEIILVIYLPPNFSRMNHPTQGCLRSSCWDCPKGPRQLDGSTLWSNLVKPCGSSQEADQPASLNWKILS